MRRTPLQDAIEMGLISGACAAFALLMFSGPFVEVFGTDVLIWMTIPAILVGLLAGWGAWARNREYAYRVEKRCRHCGYDLRASPGKCPECGRMPERRPELDGAQ